MSKNLIFGRYTTSTTPQQFYPSPIEVPYVGSQASGSLGSLYSLVGEAGYYAWVIGNGSNNIPYGLGDNESNGISQTATDHYTVASGPIPMGAASDTETFAAAVTRWTSQPVGSPTGTPGAVLPILQIDGGSNGNLAVDSVGHVFGWGNNTQGQMGNNTSGSNQPIPSPVWAVGGNSSTLLVAKAVYGAVTFGSAHSHVLLANGHVVSAGDNGFGQGGNGATLPGANILIPQLVVGGAQGGTYMGDVSPIEQISAGNRHMACLDQAGNIFTWGHNDQGQLGWNGTTDSSTPGAPIWPTGAGAPAFPFIYVNSGGGFVGFDAQCYAIDSNNDLWVWGGNLFGQLGLGTIGSPNFSSPITPTKVPRSQFGGFTVATAYSGARHGLILNSVGNLYVVGDNTLGECGMPTLNAAIPAQAGSIGTSVPTQINGPNGPISQYATINKIWAGNETSLVDLTYPFGVGGRAVKGQAGFAHV